MGPQAVWVEVGSKGPAGPGAGRGRPGSRPPPAPRTPARACATYFEGRGSHCRPLAPGGLSGS